MIITLAFIALFGIGAGIGGVAYGFDQREKLEAGDALFRDELQQLESRLSEEETKLYSLTKRLGKKNKQVRTLAAEVERLRTEVANARSRIA